MSIRARGVRRRSHDDDHGGPRERASTRQGGRCRERASRRRARLERQGATRRRSRHTDLRVVRRRAAKSCATTISWSSPAKSSRSLRAKSSTSTAPTSTRWRIVEGESTRILRRRGTLRITETRHGFINANAGWTFRTRMTEPRCCSRRILIVRRGDSREICSGAPAWRSPSSSPTRSVACGAQASLTWRSVQRRTYAGA